ncbi:MAG: MarR family transcriptional regulator [Planctomycetota bacterium]
MGKTLQAELKKRRPFDSPQQEATLAIMRTSDLLTNRIARLLRDYGLTPTQYNVLRILRGEGAPMPVSEIGERMIQVAPAVTRVVDQLVADGLADKTQSASDRRVFHVSIEAAGLELLSRLDQPILSIHETLLTGVDPSDLRQMVGTLQAIRNAAVAGPGL